MNNCDEKGKGRLIDSSRHAGMTGPDIVVVVRHLCTPTFSQMCHYIPNNPHNPNKVTHIPTPDRHLASTQKRQPKDKTRLSPHKSRGRGREKACTGMQKEYFCTTPTLPRIRQYS
jgi:hypothetical protein